MFASDVEQMPDFLKITKTLELGGGTLELGDLYFGRVRSTRFTPKVLGPQELW